MLSLINPENPKSTAIIDANRDVAVTYASLFERVERVATKLQLLFPRSLVFLYTTNSIDAIVIYLACLWIQYPVSLFELGDADRAYSIRQCYHPALLAFPGNRMPVPEGYRLVEREMGLGNYFLAYREGVEAPLHPDLALLLQTSGSTGDPKSVRLTYKNLLANAQSIAQYLSLSAQERAIQSMQFSYSYGLSLINSHLFSGGSIVLTPHSFMRPEFWQDFDRYGATSFAGVPFMYETLDRLRFRLEDHPTLCTLTQAGGALRTDLIEAFHRKSQKAGVRFFVMYGQTEATARISYVPPERLSEKIGSIGVPIPGGKMSLSPVEDAPELQQLIYTGPNVMMGYAESAEDLKLGDELGGVLQTGDLARVDEDGFFYITGRLKRFAKLFGKRINLQDVEFWLEKTFSTKVAALDNGGMIAVFVEASESFDADAMRLAIAQFAKIPPVAVVVKTIDRIPLTASGKKDYFSLAR